MFFSVLGTHTRRQSQPLQKELKLHDNRYYICTMFPSWNYNLIRQRKRGRRSEWKLQKNKMRNYGTDIYADTE